MKHMPDAHISIGQTSDKKTICIDISNATGGDICCVKCALRLLQHFIKALKKTSSGLPPNEVN